MRTGPARAGLAFFSLTLGLFAVTILLSTLDALQRQARGLVQSFGAGAFVLVPAAGDSAGAWNRRHVEFFRANLGADAWVSGVKSLRGPTSADFPVLAVDEELASARGWRMRAGRALDGLDLRQGARHAMTSVDQCQRNHWRVGEILLLGHEPYRLVGCFEAGEIAIASVSEQAVFIPYTADVLETGGESDLRRVDALVFRAKTGTAPEALRRRVAALLMQPGAGGGAVEWITPESLLQGIRRWQRAIGWTAGAGGALSLLLGAATLAGMLLTGVRERVPEIGLRRALGARRREIAALFVAEAFAMTGAAALAGMGAAEFTLRWLGGRFPLPFHFGIGTRLWPLVLAFGLAWLCSIGPAWMAARLPPAEALRND